MTGHMTWIHDGLGTCLTICDPCTNAFSLLLCSVTVKTKRIVIHTYSIIIIHPSLPYNPPNQNR